MYYTMFTVEGRGAFPLDMLRYDSCFPYAQSDVATLDNGGSRRRVTLARYHRFKDEPPSKERWASFGWHIAEADIYTTKV